MSELKPCPFCGGEPEIINRSVHCNSASCNAQPFTSWWANDDAIAAWNRRAEDAALSRLRDTQRVLVEALRGLLAEVRENARHGHPASKYWASVKAADAALASVEQQQEQPCHQTPAGDEEVTAPLPLTCWGLSSFCAETGHKCRAAGACVYAPPAPDAAMQEPKP